MSDPNVPPSPPGGGGAPPPPPAGDPPPPPGGAPPPPPPPSGHASPPADSNRTVMLILAYLWVLALVPYLTEKDDPEVKWHARHGLVLLAAEIVLWVVLTLVGMLPMVGCLITPLFVLVPLAAVIVRIVAVLKALEGKRFLIPGVSHYADQIP